MNRLLRPTASAVLLLAALAHAQDAGTEPGGVPACPGQTVTVHFPSPLPEGASFALTSEAVRAVREQRDPQGFTLDLKVSSTALPHPVALRVTAPSLRQPVELRAVDIGCRHLWTLSLATGETLRLDTSWPGGGELSAYAEGTWTRGKETLGRARYAVSSPDGSSAVVRFEPTPEQALARRERAREAHQSPRAKEFEAKAVAASKLLEACARLPQAQAPGCLQREGAKLRALQAERDAFLGDAAGGPEFGCDVLTLTASAGALRGEGSTCARGQRGVAVEGTVRPN